MLVLIFPILAIPHFTLFFNIFLFIPILLLFILSFFSTGHVNIIYRITLLPQCIRLNRKIRVVTFFTIFVLCCVLWKLRAILPLWNSFKAQILTLLAWRIRNLQGNGLPSEIINLVNNYRYTSFIFFINSIWIGDFIWWISQHFNFIIWLSYNRLRLESSILFLLRLLII